MKYYLIILLMLPLPISSNTKKKKPYAGNTHNVDSKILACNYYQIPYA